MMSGKGKVVLVLVTLLFLSLALPGLPARANRAGAEAKPSSGAPPVAKREGLPSFLERGEERRGTGGEWSTSLLEVGGATLLVLVLGGVTVFLLSRLQRGSIRGGAKRSLQVVETLRLGGRKRLHLARLAHRTVVLSETDRSLSVILSLDEDDLPPEQEAEGTGSGAVETEPLRSPFLRFFRSRAAEGGR